MKSGKSKVKSVFCITGLLTMLLVFCMPAFAGIQEGSGEYEIYPTPQDIVYESGSITLTDQVNVVCGSSIDEYTKVKINDTLAELNLKKAQTIVSSNTTLTVGVYGTKDAADTYGASHGAQSDLYQKYDAYSLWISDDGIVILGKDTDAAFRGVTTLMRIFEQLESKSIRKLTIKDYANIEFRGFIEGYYGNPWSKEDRIDLMEYGGEIKLNQYIYAPKDDPMHNKRWRDLYEDDDLVNIAQLAQAGNESKCFFVYALHPFMNNAIDLSDEKYESEVAILKAKFTQVIRDAGVRQIAILEDDAGGASAERIIRLLNDMNEWLHEMKKTYKDLKTDLLYCPTCYMNTENPKMTQIGNNVSSEIHFLVTGGTIWGQVSESFATGFFNGMNDQGKGRYPYMWVNWPCNDNTKNSQIMGGHNYILHDQINGDHYEGVVLNPIQESEPSKVGIFTASDFCWNIWQNDEQGDQAWEDSFKYIDHMTAIETESSTALRETAKHQIAQASTQPQVPFEESVDLKPLLESLRGKLSGETFTKTEVTALKAEFKKINEACSYYLEKGTNRRMASQMVPFLSCLRDMTQADMDLMDALEAHIDGNKGRLWDRFSAAQAVYGRSKTYGFDYYNAGTLYAQAGRKYIEPFTDAVLQWVSEKAVPMVNPGYDNATRSLTFSSNWSIYEGKKENLTDGNDSTYAWFDRNAAKDDWIQLDLGVVRPVKRVRILVGMTKSGKGGDKWKKYHLEHSENGTSWTRLASVTGKQDSMDIYTPDLGGVSARYIRLVNDEGYNGWFSFSEFSVDSSGDILPYTNLSDNDWQTESGDDTFKLLEKQNITLAKDQYIGIKLDRIREIASINIQGSGMDSLITEKSVNAIEWTDSQAGDARYVRVINKTDQSVTFNLSSITVRTNEIWPMDLDSTNFGGEGNVEDARKLGNTKYWMDGNLSTKAKYCAVQGKDNYVTYDLGQEITLRSLRVYVMDTAIDYPRDAVIEASLDKNSWTKILEIGDGVSNSEDDKSTKPVESEGGNWVHDSVDVAYAYVENPEIDNVKARYIRLKITAAYSHRWLELNEILINNGEYIPEENNPTFETDAKLKKGFEPVYMADDNLTTGFQPNGTMNGSVIYHLSEVDNIERINIIQSGNDISNAMVSVRTGTDEWVELGALYRSFSSFYVKDLENIYAVKVEWKNTIPLIYEIIPVAEAGDVLEKNITEAQSQFSSADTQLTAANSALGEIAVRLQKAEQEMNGAADGSIEKLRAEVAYYDILAEKCEAEALVAQLEALKSVSEAELARAEGKKIRVDAEGLTGDELASAIAQAEAKEAVIGTKISQAEEKQRIASEKKTEQAQAETQAEEKRAALDKIENVYYDITFNSNGGSEVASQSIKKNERVRKPLNPKKAGYIFEGWYRDPGCTEQYLFRSAVTANMELYANWIESDEPMVYLVRFYSNGGPAVSPQSVNEGNKAVQPENMSRNGYALEGWFTDEEFTQKYDFETEVTKDVRLYAKWVEAYMITFQTNGGSTIDKQPVAKEGRDRKATRPADPIRTGYILEGWYTDADLTTAYDFDTEVNSDFTLYAKWNESYTVTFNSNGGSNVTEQPIAKEGDNKKAKKPADPVKKGFIFEGWFTDAELTQEFDFDTDVTGNITLYAKWTQGYMVTFKSNGGTDVETSYVRPQEKAVKPKDPTKKYNRFEGWYSDEALTIIYDFNAEVTEDITLYAKWARIYTVEFDSMGGSNISAQIVARNEKVAKPKDPTKNNYTFAGWFLDEACTKPYDFGKGVTSSIILYAKWEENKGGSTGSDNPDGPGAPIITPEIPAVGRTEKYNGVTYKVTKSDVSNGTVTALKIADKKKTSIVIPATVKIGDYTFKVTSISASAFKNCSKLQKVTIGSNVTSIGKQAFYNCKKLKTINMKKAKKITSFGKNAFKKIHKKAKITVPKNKYSQYKKKMKKAVSSQKIIKK